MKMSEATIKIHVDTDEAHQKIEKLIQATDALSERSADYVIRELIQEIKHDIFMVEHLDDPGQRGYVGGLKRALQLIKKYQ